MQADAAVQKLLMERETDALLPPWIQWHEKELRILPGEGQEGTAKLHQQRFSLYLHRDGAERAAKYDADSGLRLNSGEGIAVSLRARRAGRYRICSLEI